MDLVWICDFSSCFWFQVEFNSAEKVLEAVTHEIEAMSEKDSGASETRAKEYPGEYFISDEIWIQHYDTWNR